MIILQMPYFVSSFLQQSSFVLQTEKFFLVCYTVVKDVLRTTGWSRLYVSWRVRPIIYLLSHCGV